MRGAAPFASFWFDCDSTLSSIEGVDVLSGRISAELLDEVRQLTQRAMDGEIPLAEVYEHRLSKIAPNRGDLEAAGRSYIQNLVPDARRTVAALRSLGKTVGIISGGLRQPVAMLARALGVPEDCVFAVAAILDEDGNYVGFDRESPLWQNGGKPAVLGSRPKDQYPLLFVGDGATDLEAKDQVDLFVGFGGVVRRQAVEENADAYITENSLRPVLDIGLTQGEKQRLRQDQRFRDLWSKQGE
jgi:phosphoserine phosphatase